MSDNITNSLTLPVAPIAVKIAVGKPATGEKIVYETVSVDVSRWTAGQVTQWLAAGIANIAGDRLAGAAKASGYLEGLALINYKRKLAQDFAASLAGPDAFPGRKPSSDKPKAGKIPSLESLAAMLSATIDPEDLGMDTEQFASALPKMAAKLRAKRISEIGRNPDTYDAEEAAKAASEATEASSETQEG